MIRALSRTLAMASLAIPAVFLLTSCRTPTSVPPQTLTRVIVEEPIRDRQTTFLRLRSQATEVKRIENARALYVASVQLPQGFEATSGSVQVHLPLSSENVATGYLAPGKESTRTVQFEHRENLLNGMPVELTLAVPKNATIYLLPINALVAPTGGTPFVLTERQGVVTKHAVTPLQWRETHLQSLVALSPEERIIVAGHHKVLPGDRVSAVVRGGGMK